MALHRKIITKFEKKVSGSNRIGLFFIQEDGILHTGGRYNTTVNILPLYYSIFFPAFNAANCFFLVFIICPYI